MSQKHIDRYVQSKYEAYLSGQPLGTIAFSVVGMQAHRVALKLLDIKRGAQELFPKAALALEQFFAVHDLAADLEFEVFKATHPGFGLALDAAKPYLQEHLQPVINEITNDITPETKEAFSFAMRTLDLASLGSIGTGLAKTGFRTMAGNAFVRATALETVKLAASSTAKLGGLARRTPLARVAINSIDSLKATTAAVEAECSSAARNLNDLLSGSLGQPSPALASRGLRPRPTMSPSVAKPVSLARVADDAATLPGRTAGTSSAVTETSSSTPRAQPAASTHNLVKTAIDSDAGSGFLHRIEVDVMLLEREIAFPEAQVQSKFKKHAKDFGVPGSYDKSNERLFEQKILEHISDPGTLPIAGKYHVQEVIHYYNPTTKLNVMKDTYGNFISGWKLEELQIEHLKTTGKLGGSK